MIHEGRRYYSEEWFPCNLDNESKILEVSWLSCFYEFEVKFEIVGWRNFIIFIICRAELCSYHSCTRPSSCPIVHSVNSSNSAVSDLRVMVSAKLKPPLSDEQETMIVTVPDKKVTTQWVPFPFKCLLALF